MIIVMIINVILVINVVNEILSNNKLIFIIITFKNIY